MDEGLVASVWMGRSRHCADVCDLLRRPLLLNMRMTKARFAVCTVSQLLTNALVPRSTDSTMAPFAFSLRSLLTSCLVASVVATCHGRRSTGTRKRMARESAVFTLEAACLALASPPIPADAECVAAFDSADKLRLGRRKRVKAAREAQGMGGCAIGVVLLFFSAMACFGELNRGVHR